MPRCSAVAYFSANGQPDNINTHDDGKSKEEMLPKPVNSSDETPPGTARLGGGGEGDDFKIQGVAAAALSPSSATPTSGTTSSSPVIRQLLGPPPLTQTRLHVPASPSSAPGALGQSSGGRSTAPPPHATLMAVASPPAPIKKRSKTTAEQRSRMREFAYRVGWSIRKAGAGAVDAFCAQVGVPRRALRMWMANNRHLARIPPPSLPSPPLPSRQQDQDHSPAATPPQGSVTEDGKPPEPEAAAPADDGGKEDGNEEASDEVTQIGRGHRSRKPNKRYGGQWNSIWM